MRKGLRRGVTIFELLIASAISALLIAMLTGSVILYGRYYRRGDALLDQSRRFQTILDRFREDFRHATGTLKLSEIPEEPLRSLGLDRSRDLLLESARAGAHVVHSYAAPDSPAPTTSDTYPFEEVWSFSDLEDPARAQASASRYRGPIPPSGLLDTLKPRAPVGSVLVVPLPTDEPKSWYVIVRHESEGTGFPVIWAYHEEKVLAYPPRSLLRWTPETGVVAVAEGGLAKFSCELFTEWIHVIRPTDTTRGPGLELSKFFARLEVAFEPAGPRSAPVRGTVFIVQEP